MIGEGESMDSSSQMGRSMDASPDSSAAIHSDQNEATGVVSLEAAGCCVSGGGSGADNGSHSGAIAAPEAPFSWIEGGICAPLGFKASGVLAGFKKTAAKPDLALIVADEPSAAAATFTQNVFCAAPVRFCKSQFEAASGSSSWGSARAIVINSGNANAATGQRGLDACAQEAALVSEAVGCDAADVLVASTGVIGVQLPLQPLERVLPSAVAGLSRDGAHDAARAIMTTDTFSKECAVSFDGDAIGYPGRTFRVGGMSKGSGMIMPNMATMIAVITTDAPVLASDLRDALKAAVDVSFNKITVDSDTSTNDTCFAMASGAAAPGKAFKREGEAFAALSRAIAAVCTKLARMMARDGEGATRLVDVIVKGAATPEDADAVARTVANSPLVKTAIAGRDANWGRIAAAAGRSGARFNQENVDISIMGMEVCRSGLALEFDEACALERFESDEIEILIDLGAGSCETTVWTCDFTHDYISINADYRT